MTGWYNKSSRKFKVDTQCSHAFYVCMGILYVCVSLCCNWKDVHSFSLCCLPVTCSLPIIIIIISINGNSIQRWVSAELCMCVFLQALIFVISSYHQIPQNTIFSSSCTLQSFLLSLISVNSPPSWCDQSNSPFSF